MKPSDLSEFFSLLGKAKKEKEEEFDNLLKEADINLDDLTSSLVSGIKEAKEDQKKQKKNEEKLIEQLDSIIDVIENPKEVKDITEPAVTVGVPEDFDVSKLEEENPLDVQDWNDGKDVKFTEVDAVDVIKPEPIKTPEISDTVAQAIKFIEETNIKEEIENSDDTNLDKLKTEIKQVRDILYKVLAHGPGSGEVRVLRMDDVDITDLGDEKVLSYDASSEKLKFVEQSGGSGVSTENVRTGILDVAGIATFRNDTLVGSGITLSPDGDVFVTGVTTATKFVGDGSGLTGITASGSGVVVQDEGSAIGTAATINFIGSNVTAALSGGIANVTVTPGITTANVRTGILDVAGIATFRNDTLIGSGVTLSPDGDVFVTGVTTSSSFVGDLTGDVTGTASNATQLNSQAASYYLNYNNFSNTPTIPSNNNQLTNGAGFITASDDITGNAATSTKLATARTIAGVSFDGSANISLNNNAITNGAGYITTSFTNTNQLTNGAGFITASDDITGNAATATALANARTIAGVSFDGSANISLNNNAITNGAGYITGSALNASNLSSGTIPDARFPSTLPAIDGSALTGIAVTDNIRTNTNATFLQNVNVSGTTTATTFIGNLTGNVTGNVSGSSGSSTGNAATATALANARTIGGVSFDGSANIDLPGVNSAGNQNTTGTSAGLTGTPSITVNAVNGATGTFSGNVTIGGVLAYEDVTNVDAVGVITARSGVLVGSGITLSPDGDIFAIGVTTSTTFVGALTGNVTGNTSGSSGSCTGNAATATALETARTIAGVSFDGSANISLNNNAITNGAGFIDGSALNASNLSSGTIPDARFPSTLPAISGENLTGIAATANVRTGILDVAGIATFRSDTLVGSGITLSPDGNVFAVGVSTFNGLVKLPDSSDNQTGRLMFGDGTDLQIFHTGSAGEIGNFTGNLNVKSNSFRIFNGAANQVQLRTDQNDSVILYHSGNEKIKTTNTGAVVTGILTATSNVNVGSGITLSPDGNVFTTGISTFTGAVGIGSTLSIGNEDILIRHDPDMFGDIYNEISFNNGNVFFVNKDTSKPYMYIRSNDIQLRDWSNNREYIHCANSLSVKLNYNGSERFVTTNAGAKVTGDLEITGVLTYEDVTNVDSIGIITARAGVLVGSGITLSPDGDIFAVGLVTAREGIFIPDNKKLELGNAAGSGDLQLFHDTANSYIVDNGPGQLYIRGSAAIHLENSSGSEKYFRGVANGAAELYFNGVNKFETTNTGVTVTGTAVATSFTGDLTGDVTGNADTATALETARTIGGTSFDGTANIVPAEATNADTVDSLHASSFIRSDADDSFTGTLTAASDGSNPVIKIQGGGPNFIQFASDNSGTVDADSINLIYRATPNTLAYERASDDTVLFSVDADNAAATFSGALSGTTGTFSGDLSVAQNIVHTGDTDTKIEFATNTITFDTAGSERLRITSDGKIGIGLASPKTDLDIANDAGGTLTLSCSDDSSSADQLIGKINFYTADPSGDGPQNNAIISAHSVTSTGSGAYLKFSTATGATGSEGADAVERLRIDANGNIGINAIPRTSGAIYDTVDHFLVIGDTDTGIAQDGDGELELWANNQEIVNLNTTGVTFTKDLTIPDKIIHSGDANTAIRFPANDVISFETVGVERARFTSNGLCLGGTGSANGLSDYEEGTFTPSYTTSNTNIGTVTYDIRGGRYTKIGRMVYFTLRMRTDSISNVGSGTIRITGFPFTHINSQHHRALSHNIYTANWTSADAPSIALFVHSQTYLQLYQKNYNEDGVALASSSFNTGANDNDIRITGFYETSQ